MKTNFYKKIGVKGLQELATEYKVNDDIAFVKKNVKKKEMILDLACGYGRVSLVLAESGYENVTGIDLAVNLVLAARKEAKFKKLKIKFDVGTMVSLPYEKDSFDKIFCLWNSFNEILKPKEQVKTLREARRVLRLKGKAFFVVFDGESKQIRQMMRTGDLNPKNPVLRAELKGAEAYQYIYTKTILLTLAKKAGFKKPVVRSIQLHKRRRLLLVLTK